MADNIPTTANASIATDDIGNIHFQRMKLVIGADGVNDGDVASGNPLPVEGTVLIDDTTPVDVAVTGTVPVSGPLTDTQLRATAVPVADQPALVVELIDQASGTITYFGQAAPGTATSAASWRIQRMSVSGTVTTFQYADGNLNFDNVWDNRAALTYS
jgi:hypothetical protein